jgi:curved DNA-binding protein CbpA
MNGSLSENPLAEIVREIGAAALSGALRLARERVKAVVYAQGGAVVYARSNLRAHRLAECARRAGTVDEKKLSAVVTEMMSDAAAGAALVESRALTHEGLTQLRVRQVLDVLRPALLWTDGDWSFDPRARLVEDVGVRFDHQQLLLEGARRMPAEFCAARLDDPEEMIAPAPAQPTHLQLSPVEAFILSRADAPARLGELVLLCGMPEAQTLHGIYALALCGFLARQRWTLALAAETSTRSESAGATTAMYNTTSTNVAGALTPRAATREGDAQTADAAAGETDTRAEIDALLARTSDANHYDLLGVDRNAAVADIKRAYYALAKRFHPDRFRRAADEETRAQIEAAFAKIARAYETLRDSRERASYDSKLNARIVEPAGAASQRRGVATSTDGNYKPRSAIDPTQTSQYRAETSFQQGLASMQRGDAAAARLYFGEAVRLAPQQARYHALYGRALATDAPTRRQAEAELRTAVTLDPRNVSYYVSLAELYVAVGLQRRAEGELERALSLEPQHVAARQMLERMKGKG